jgi:hypothetical protein
MTYPEIDSETGMVRASFQAAVACAWDRGSFRVACACVGVVGQCAVLKLSQLYSTEVRSV